MEIYIQTTKEICTNKTDYFVSDKTVIYIIMKHHGGTFSHSWFGYIILISLFVLNFTANILQSAANTEACLELNPDYTPMLGSRHAPLGKLT